MRHLSLNKTNNNVYQFCQNNQFTKVYLENYQIINNFNCQVLEIQLLNCQLQSFNLIDFKYLKSLILQECSIEELNISFQNSMFFQDNYNIAFLKDHKLYSKHAMQPVVSNIISFQQNYESPYQIFSNFIKTLIIGQIILPDLSIDIIDEQLLKVKQAQLKKQQIQNLVIDNNRVDNIVIENTSLDEIEIHLLQNYKLDIKLNNKLKSLQLKGIHNISQLQFNNLQNLEQLNLWQMQFLDIDNIIAQKNIQINITECNVIINNSTNNDINIYDSRILNQYIFSQNSKIKIFTSQIDTVLINAQVNEFSTDNIIKYVTIEYNSHLNYLDLSNINNIDLVNTSFQQSTHIENYNSTFFLKGYFPEQVILSTHSQQQYISYLTFKINLRNEQILNLLQ